MQLPEHLLPFKCAEVSKIFRLGKLAQKKYFKSDHSYAITDRYWREWNHEAPKTNEQAFVRYDPKDKIRISKNPDDKNAEVMIQISQKAICDSKLYKEWSESLS